MINGEPEDELRRLVIAFYPADGEMAAFEAWTPRIRMSFHPNGPTQVSPKQQGRQGGSCPGVKSGKALLCGYGSQP